MSAIVSDQAFCKSLAIFKDPFKQSLYNIQLALTTEENKDSIGSVIFALKSIHDIFEDIIVHGEALIQEENKKKKQ